MKIDIERLLPHRGRMKLVDKILEVDENAAATESTVTDRWPLIGINAAPLVLIELVAQTSAVCIGWKELKEDDKATPEGSGWLVGIKSAVFFPAEIPVDTKIVTRTRIDFTMDNYTQIIGEARSNGDPLCEIVLQVLKNEVAGESN